MTTLALLGVGYVTALAFILAILKAAKLGDEAMARRLGGPDGAPETPPADFAPSPGVRVRRVPALHAVGAGDVSEARNPSGSSTH